MKKLQNGFTVEPCPIVWRIVIDVSKEAKRRHTTYRLADWMWLKLVIISVSSRKRPERHYILLDLLFTAWEGRSTRTDTCMLTGIGVINLFSLMRWMWARLSSVLWVRKRWERFTSLEQQTRSLLERYTKRSGRLKGENSKLRSSKAGGCTCTYLPLSGVFFGGSSKKNRIG